MNPSLHASFHSLDPQFTLKALDTALAGLGHARTTGRILALNSLENRVYLVELEDSQEVVVKYYRPQRWNREQIGEEHRFLFLLADSEIPAVAPLGSAENSIFATSDGILFAIFPRVRGRLRDELSHDQLRTIGRYLGRIHKLAQTFPLHHRPQLDVLTFGDDSLDLLEKHHTAKSPLGTRYIQIAEDFLDAADPFLNGRSYQTVHGDCHVGNILWDGESPFLIDFDDVASCIPEQDLWLITPGRDKSSLRDRDALLEGYAEFSDTNELDFSCVEALRGLRMIHFNAWVAKRWDDPIFHKVFPEFGSDRHWGSEIEALMETMDVLRHLDDTVSQ